MNFDSEESLDTLKKENFETKHSKILHESKDKELGHKLVEVGNTMLTNHREIMTKMLGTMKYEMTLVHSTDENRVML